MTVDPFSPLLRTFGTDRDVLDVTLSFSAEVPTWPSHPPSEVTPLRRIAAGDPSNVTRVALSSHAATHVDAPWHFIDDGKTMSDIPLSRWSGECFVVRIPDEVTVIEPGDLEAAAIPEGTTRLLLRTANSTSWQSWSGREPLVFCENYVGVSPDAARWVIARGIELVGIDYLSIGPFGAANRETHLALLSHDVLIIETLDLSAVEAGAYDLICMPLKLAAGDGAPARVLLVRRS
jgi:arylformamidase